MAVTVEPRYPQALTWHNFLPHDVTNQLERAQVSLTIGFPHHLPHEHDRRSNDYHLGNIVLHVAINRHQTWAAVDARSDYLLRHEQGHYYIGWLVARAMARELENLHASDLSFLSYLANQTQITHSERLDHLQRSYDAETQHGNNHPAQSRWNAMIFGTLSAFAADQRHFAIDRLNGMPL